VKIEPRKALKTKFPKFPYETFKQKMEKERPDEMEMAEKEN